MTGPRLRPTRPTTPQADALIAAYAASWNRITDELRRLMDDPRQFRRVARLRAMQASIGRELTALDARMRRFVTGELAATYARGAAAGAGGAVAMDAIHTEAVELLVNDTFRDLLAATDKVRATTRALVRQVAKDEALAKAIEGRTATQAGREMRRILETHKVHAVRYRDGRRVGLADYSDMVIRTKTAVAYNVGTLNGAPDVQVWEIFDGPSCGLTFHDDPQLANGLLVDRATAEAFPISHPRCVRGLGARPDLTAADLGRRDLASTTQAQRDEQVRLEREARERRVARARRARQAARRVA